jgi:hypothetical protein
MNIEAARAVRIEDVLARRGIKLNGTKRWLEGPCPRCGGTDRFSVDTDRQLFNCRNCGGKGKTAGKGDVIAAVKFLDGCDTATAIATLAGEHSGTPNGRVAPARNTPKTTADEQADRLELARYLWRKRRPIIGSLGEKYLRARGYTGALPRTLGFLPPSAKYPDPTLIAAFGLATEIDVAEHERRWRAERGMPLPAPGPDDPIANTGALPVSDPQTLHIADRAVVGVHLIKLLADGSDRRRDIKDAKITIGIDFVAPIVLAPVGDNLTLVIAEGIEDALSDHDLTGRGAWAAASAGRLPGLADLVPSYVGSVTILVDDNPAGRAGSAELADALHRRGIEVLMAGNWS